ncbi:MAG: hypothetical protein ACJ768_18005 [Gaiellaceae bacterium]
MERRAAGALSGLVARQREMYAGDESFIEKWRAAWRFQEKDLKAGYSKIWMELQAPARAAEKLAELL